MQYSDIEQKLLRLALDSAAHSGESANAATMFIKALRKRGVHANQIINNGGGSPDPIFERLFQSAQTTISQLNVTIDALRRENIQLKQAKTTSEAPHDKPKRRPWKKGYSELSNIERGVLFRFSGRVGAMNGEIISKAAIQTDHQVFQRLMKKEFVTKCGRNMFRITTKGIEYVRQYK